VISLTSRLPEHIADQLALPIITAPMFLVSSPKMVMEACKSGVIGSFPLLNARTTDILEKWMQDIVNELSDMKQAEPHRKVGPWAVNVIVHKSNVRYEADLELIKEYKPPIVITSLGDPSRVTSIVHGYGGLVFSDVINTTFAKKAIAKGVDGLILVSAGAGGHGGIVNPFAFVSAVREFWDGIVILAGAISNGNEIVAAEMLGADLVFMGTRFIAASEAFSSEDYKNMLMDSTFEDLVYTDAFSGIKANYLVKSIEKAGLDPSNLPDKQGIDFSKMGQHEAKAWKDIWSAGHGVSTIHDVKPVSQIVEELKAVYQTTITSITGKQIIR
jgi:nitronate monooxygenase